MYIKKSAIWYRLFTLVLRGQGSTVKSPCQGQKSRSPNTYKLICHILHVLLRPDISKRSRLKGQGYPFNISASVSYRVWMRQYWRCMDNSTQLSKLISITHTVLPTVFDSDYKLSFTLSISNWPKRLAHSYLVHKKVI